MAESKFWGFVGKCLLAVFIAVALSAFVVGSYCNIAGTELAREVAGAYIFSIFGLLVASRIAFWRSDVVKYRERFNGF